MNGSAVLQAALQKKIASRKRKANFLENEDSQEAPLPPLPSGEASEFLINYFNTVLDFYFYFE